MKNYWTLVLLLSSFSGFAQCALGIQLNPGASLFTTKFDATEPSYSKQTFVPMLSGQAGLYFNCTLGEHHLLGAEILFLQIEGREKIVTDAVGTNGEHLGFTITDHITRGISYIGLPVYYGYNFGKLNVNLGFQLNYTVASYAHEWGGFTDTSGTNYSWDNKGDKLFIDKFSYGPRAGVLWELTPRWSLNANYYYGLNNIIEDTSIEDYWHWKIQQLTIGVRYNLSRPLPGVIKDL